MKTPSTTERKKPRPKPRQAVARDLTDRTERATGGDLWSCGYRPWLCKLRPYRLPVGRPKVFSRHRAAGRFFNRSATLNRNRAVPADPLIDHRRRHANKIGECRLRPCRPASFKNWIHAQSLAALTAAVNSRAIRFGVYAAA